MKSRGGIPKEKAFTIILIVTALLIAWAGGRNNGIRHAITSSEIRLAEYEEPEEGNGDWVINIDLDGWTYQHVIWMH